MLKQVKSFPPNIEKIRQKFDLSNKDIVFTYGTILYNPTGNFIDHPLMAHEETHMRQQGDKPEEWWKKYLDDDSFRLSQEIEAYRNQYKVAKKLIKDRNKLNVYRTILASDLSGLMYGNIISFFEALNEIKC